MNRKKKYIIFSFFIFYIIGSLFMAFFLILLEDILKYALLGSAVATTIFLNFILWLVLISGYTLLYYSLIQGKKLKWL